MCSAPWYAARSPERSASTAGATDATAASSSRAAGRNPDSRSPRTNTAAPSMDASVCGLSNGSRAAGSFALICGSSRSASASRAGPRRRGFWILAACRRFRAEATSICPSPCRIAHAQACGPCTSTPFGSAIPPSRIFSSAIARRVVAEPLAEDRFCGVAKPADGEIEVGDRDPLVGGVDERRGNLRRQLARGGEEAVGDGAEGLAQPVAVGEADACERGSLRSGLGLGDPLLERPPQRRVERRARPPASLDPLELVFDVPAEYGADDRLYVFGVLAGQEPAVDHDLAYRRDDVSLLRGGDDGGREGRREKGLDHGGRRARELAQARHRFRGGGHRAEHDREEALRLGAELRLGPECGDPLDQRRSLDERV